jgi:hypothetical protein
MVFSGWRLKPRLWAHAVRRKARLRGLKDFASLGCLPSSALPNEQD